MVETVGFLNNVYVYDVYNECSKPSFELLAFMNILATLVNIQHILLCLGVHHAFASLHLCEFNAVQIFEFFGNSSPE